jgi:hypothetical protein
MIFLNSTKTGQACESLRSSAHARVRDDAGPARISRSRHGPSRLLLDGKHQRPELVLRRSIPSLRTPLSTLRLQPRDRTRMTRGRCGSLRLHRNGLAPSTFRRSPGAPVHSIHAPKQTASLFDHLVGKREQLIRNLKAERLGGLEVDHQLEFGGLLDGQIGWLLAI